MEEIEQGGVVTLDGKAMTDEAKNIMTAALKLGLQAARPKTEDRFITRKGKIE